MDVFCVQDCHLLWFNFPEIFRYKSTVHVVVLQPLHCRNNTGLGCSPFARHYSGNHYCFLFLRVLRCFSSPGLPPDYSGSLVFNQGGCPIRKSPDRRLFAPPRSLSQLVTSFIASESQGIRHALLITFLPKVYYNKKNIIIQRFLGCQ